MSDIAFYHRLYHDIPYDLCLIKHYIEHPTRMTCFKVMQLCSCTNIPYTYALVITTTDNLVLIKV